MNLNDEEEDLFFTQRCLELANLLRTEQTEDFLQLYDSLPPEWTASREYLQLETAKESIRQYQELDENEFQLLYQRAFENEQHQPTIIMSNLPIQPTVIRDHDNEQTITTNNRITSLALLQQKQHNERMTANNLACDEKHDLTSKHSSSIKRNNEEFNTKTRRLQSITNNNTHDLIQKNSRNHTPVDSFVQLNLQSPINIRLEDYKKAIDPMSVTQKSTTINRSFIPQSIETNESNQQSISQSNIIKKHPITTTTTTTNKSHEDASFDYFSANNEDEIRQHSRSSSSSSSINNKNDLSRTQILSQSNSLEHSKLIANNDMDSHGSSIATKSSSENSGSARTASGSDSDDEHHRLHQSGKYPALAAIKSSQSSKNKSSNYDDTPTIVLNQTSDNRTSKHDRILSLPEQHSYELVELNTNNEHPLLGQISRFKQPVMDDPNGINNSNSDLLSHTAQRSQQNNLSSSSHQNHNPERHEQYNTNHSNSSRKSASRTNKKRKQLQQQDIIRTELIPGHRGDRDVDELVMFIDGDSSSKQRQNSVPLRPTDTNSNPTSRRKSRKPIKILQDNEHKTSPIDDETQSISFIDEDDQPTTTTTHSLNNNDNSSTYHDEISLPNDDEESHSNTTNGEISFPEWQSTSPTNDEIDSLSLSSITLNHSNSEIISEPFVTVTHRRRSIKERRNNNSSSSSRTFHFPDKPRFQSIQNGILRPTIQNSLSNIKPFVSTTTKDENTNITSPPARPPPSSISQTSVLPSTSVPEQSSPRLSSHSSSSSLSSSLKRQSKAPPVVFLNKSIDIELNDVSFGFDIENPTSDKPPTPPPAPPSEPLLEKEVNPSSSSRRSYQQQRTSHGPSFYSASDTRPHQYRNYPYQSQYIDPLLLQYNQQRYQQLAYLNLLRTQYLSSQSPYVLIPNPTTINPDEKDETSEQIQEPLLVYTTIPGQTGPIYYQPNKKSYESVYPSQYFYPTHPAYFQPIPSSLLIDNKSQQGDTDHDDVEEEEDNDYEKSTRLFQQTRQQSSSHIMSNALQLVYSQEKRNAQTDRFNLDQLTAYLAMKWTETVDHYEQGDDEILLTGEQ